MDDSDFDYIVGISNKGKEGVILLTWTLGFVILVSIVILILQACGITM